MVRNCVFLSYHHESFETVERFAQEHQVRGLVPWVDKLPGGFEAGDNSENEARRVIRDDASAFVLYLTNDCLTSRFIRAIVIPEALERKSREPTFPPLVVSPDFSFKEIQELTLKYYGSNLALNHGFALTKDRAETSVELVTRSSKELLRKHLNNQKPSGSSEIEIQISSWDRLPSTEQEILCVDMTGVLGGNVQYQDAWQRSQQGLIDVKLALSARYGRPTIVVNGSKQLTTAFLIGRILNRFPMRIRQTPQDFWETEGLLEATPPLSMEFVAYSYADRSLVVQITAGVKNLSAGVDVALVEHEIDCGGRLNIHLTDGTTKINDVTSRSMVELVYEELDRVANAGRTFVDIHIFVAVPQAFFMSLGRRFQDMPDVQLYEWTGAEYVQSCVVPGNLDRLIHSNR